MQLQNFDIAAFLRDTWQQKPLLIRSAWTDWSNPIAPDELAGLACEDVVEARIVSQRENAWELEHGPFTARSFSQPRGDPWTLLVQSVDHHCAAVAALLDPFRFVPDWRIDDVMVSYAVDGGGVGAHFDHYDVFLVQGLGRRCWEIGALCDEDTPLLPHDGLRLLADFHAAEQWVLEPGDMLYIPPRIAHRGVAIGDDCMTYSIGFRAPSAADLIENWADDLVPELSQADRYGDPELAPQDNPGEISADAITQLQGLIADKLLDRSRFMRWFGQYNTAPKNPEIDWRPDHAATVDDVRQQLAAGAALVRNPASRLAFVRDTASTVLLFADGHCYACPGAKAAFAQSICADRVLAVPPDAAEPVLELIAALIGEGCLSFDDEE